MSELTTKNTVISDFCFHDVVVVVAVNDYVVVVVAVADVVAVSGISQRKKI